MKRLLCAALLATASAPLWAGIGVSVNIGDPGFYGQLDLGGAPPPQLLYSQPMIIQQPSGYAPAPIYLHVPPEHARHWRNYCGQYGACGRPVYFVRENWYNNVYAPQYRQRHGHGGDWHGGPGPGDRHDDRGRDDRGHDDHGHDHR